MVSRFVIFFNINNVDRGVDAPINSRNIGNSSMDYLYEAIEPTRLYIKRCPHCGLKYFGKTTKQNIEAYTGSGLRWSNHLKKHLSKPEHMWHSDWYYDTSIKRFALKFSHLNRIVDSDLWANLIPENGINGGGDCSQMHTEEIRQKVRTICTERYNTPIALHSEGARQKAVETCLKRYGKTPAQLLSNELSIEKRNATNLALYGSRCAANKDGNKNSRRRHVENRSRDIVYTIKSIAPFSEHKLQRNWWHQTCDVLNQYLILLLNHLKPIKKRNKRDALLQRKNVRMLIMINNLVPLKLGQNWFQQTDDCIDRLYEKTIKVYPKELDIALRSYPLVFQE
jgi:hypothetical protein